jgi:8-oxo-dGTP diphosphatase
VNTVNHPTRSDPMSKYKMNPYIPESDAEKAYLEAYDPSKYPSVFTTVDIAIFTMRGGRLHVLLIERADFPYKGCWALPGGFVEPDETLDEAALRELAEETSLTGDQTGHLEQLGTYGDPGRDPRGRIIDVAYIALLPDVPDPEAGSDAAHARFWAIEDLVEEQVQLAFDHPRILADALERAAGKLEYTTLATTFCAEEFTLTDLRRVYEAMWGTALDKANFARKAQQTDGFVVAQDKQRTGGSRGAPARLFKAGDATDLHPAMLRPAEARNAFLPDADARTIRRNR